jgi:hypothetical protein
MGFGSSFIGELCSVEERERESRHRAGLRSAGGAGMPFGCAWRPLGTSGPTWQDGGTPAETARAVGEAARRHVGEGRAAQACSSSGSGRWRWFMRARQRQRRSGTRGRRRGQICKISKVQGPHCNALVTFKPVLNWRWAQKQKCRVFQNLQLCFKVHLL